MYRTQILMVIALVGLAMTSASTVSAENSVVIESKSVPANATDVVVHVKLANDDTLSIIEIPLEIRAITPGSFVTSVEVSFQERMASALQDYRITGYYSAFNGTCIGSGQPAYRVRDCSVTDTTVTVTAAPSGLIITCLRTSLAHDLASGVDSIGSIALRFSVTGTPGTFEIDTTCIGPEHHLFFFHSYVATGNLIIPSFTKGIITITDCDCSHHGDIDGDGFITSLDLGLLIDHVYGGQPAPPSDPSCPHVDRGDVDCNGYDDSLDVGRIIDILYAGASACEPCDCDPYPTSCP